MGFGLDIKKNDQVQVIAGRDKGKVGRVLEVEPGKRRLYVEHVNMIKRHTRPNPTRQIRGGILEKEGPIHVSNVMLICPGCGKHTRVGHSKLPDGKRVRVCRRCDTTFEN